MLYDITYMWNLENTRKNKKFKNTMNQCLKQKKAEIHTLRRNQWLLGREAIQGWGSWRYKLLVVGQAQGCTVQHGEYIQYFVIGVNRKIVSNFQNNFLKLSGKKKRIPVALEASTERVNIAGLHCLSLERQNCKVSLWLASGNFDSGSKQCGLC